MSLLDPKALVEGPERIGAEAIARQNDAALDEYFADDFVLHGPDGDATLDDLKQLWAGMWGAFTGFAVARVLVLLPTPAAESPTRS